MRRAFVGIVVLSSLFASCAPAKAPSTRGLRHAVHFERDTLFEGAQLPIVDGAWSPSGRWFVVRRGDSAWVVDATRMAASAAVQIPPRSWRFVWSPDERTLACESDATFGRREIKHVVHLLQPGRVSEQIPISQELHELLWLPTGALIGVMQPDEYVMLNPGASSAGAGDCGRLWATHEDRSSADHRWVGLMPTVCAPAFSDPIPALPGWSRVAFDRKSVARVWWEPRKRQFILQHDDFRLLRCDSMGRTLEVALPLQKGAAVYALTSDGKLAVGRVNPSTGAPGVRLAWPAYVWSVEDWWRAPIAGLEHGISGASASPVDDRVLIQTTNGVELGRLVIER